MNIRRTTTTKPTAATARRHTILSLALAAALALAPALSACGKRGKPEPPPEADGTYPHTYPAPSTYPDYPPTPVPPATAPPATAPPADAPR
jgi:hypothetical protein